MAKSKLTSIMVSQQTRDLVKTASRKSDVRMRPLAELYLTTGANKHREELKRRKKK